MTTASFIELQVRSGIATICFNRPEKRNAMSDEMRSEFIAALEAVAADKAITALVLTGRGKGFCAGGDIAGMEKRMQAPAGEVAFNGWHRQQRVHHTQMLLHTMPKPTIPGSRAASGLGADTALACVRRSSRPTQPASHGPTSTGASYRTAAEGISCRGGSGWRVPRSSSSQAARWKLRKRCGSASPIAS